MPSAPRKTQPSQVETFRRGIDLVRLLAEKPRRVVELAAALEIEPRSVQILLASLREAGVEVETEARGRERYHSLKVIPTWLARAVRVLAER